MSCLQPDSKARPLEVERISKATMGSDGELTAHAQLAALHRRTSRITAALAALTVLTLALLSVSVAAIVAAKAAQHDVDRLEASLAATMGSPTSGTGESGAAGTTGGSGASQTASGGGGGGGVYLSDSPLSPEGYLPAGSMYRGSGYWSNSTSNLPGPRSHFATVALGDRVFLLGGLDANGTHLDSVIAYDAVLDTYITTLASLPGPRARLAAAAVGDDTLVVIGGYKDAASVAAQAPESCVFQYTISTNTWATGDCSGEALADACAAGIDGKVYVAGGAAAGGKLSDSIRSYDPAAQAWASAASLPSGARADAACAAIESKMYIAGGRSSDGALSNELLSFDAASGEVKILAPMPYASGDVELVVLPGEHAHLLSIGGIGETSTPGVQAPTHYVQQYHPALDTWVEQAPIALARLHAGAAAVAGGVYAFGGVLRCTPDANGACTERPVADVEVFYDVDHPDVFIHLKDPAAADGAPTPSASKVLLAADGTPQTGFQNMGLLHAGSGYWATEQVLPVSALSDHAVVSVGNSLYILGGALIVAGNQTATADVWEFDTLLSTYTPRAPMPTPRTRAGATALDGKLYVTGGFSSADPNDEGDRQETFVYDIETDVWSESDAVLNEPRSDACMAAVGGKLYIAGGYDSEYKELSSGEVLDPSTNVWTLLGRPMPTPRGDVMCTSFPAGATDRFVVVGGYYDPTGNFTVGLFRTEVEAYDPVTGNWTSLAPLPQARGDNALVQLPGNRMLVMGGETGTGNRNQVAHNDVDMYLADHDVWVPMAPMPEPRFRFDAAYANGFVYAFGGATTSICTDDGADCNVRGGAQTAFKYLDIDYPDVFVFLADE